MKKPINPLIAALAATLPRLNIARMSAAGPTPQAGADELLCPVGWPRLMAWPPGDLLQQFAVADAARKKQIRDQLETYNADMKKRADAARAWLIEAHKSPAPAGGNLDMGGIMFASLVVPGGVPPALGQIVAKWGFDTLVTRDGGELHATRSELKLRRGTPEAVQALVIEAKKRGWASIEVSGSKSFKKQVALEAAKYGLPVRTRDASGKSVVLSTGQPELEKQLAAQAAAEKLKQPSQPEQKTAASKTTVPNPAAPEEMPPQNPSPQPTAGDIDIAPAHPQDPKVVSLDQHRDRAHEGAPLFDPEPRPA